MNLPMRIDCMNCHLHLGPAPGLFGSVNHCGFCYQLMQLCAGKLIQSDNGYTMTLYGWIPTWVNLNIYAPPFVTGKTHSSRQKSQQLYTKIGFVLTGKKTQKTDILNHPSFYYRSFTLHTLRCCLRDPWLRKLRILIGNTYASNAKLYQFHFCSTCVCCGWNISVQPKP